MSKSPFLIFRLLYKYRFLAAGLLILLAGAFIRLYRLGEMPAGLTWDEAAIGYNGYSIVTIRRDEWLQFLPVSFRSFGDYKAPLAIYLNGPFTFLLGLNPLAVRLPFALSGIAAIAGMMLITKEIWSNKKEAKLAALLSGGMLALSPWHIQFTRAGFESGLALTLILWAVYFFYAAFKKTKKNRVLMKLLISSGLFAMSFYAYHSTKLFTPLFVILLAWLFRKQVVNHIREVATSAAAGLLLLIPLIYDSFFGNGLERAGVTVFSAADSNAGALKQILSNFFYHLRPQFLFLGEIDTYRHGTGSWGVLLATTALFFFLTILWLLYSLLKRRTLSNPMAKQALFFLSWIIMGLLPAAIGQHIPHSNRSLMALPGFIGFGLTGLFAFRAELETHLKASYKNLARSFIGMAALVHVLLFLAYFSHYLYIYPANAAADYNEGYLEALQIAEKYEHGSDGYPKVKQILVSSKYGQPVIFTLFVKGISPITYHQGGLIKYLFTDEVTMADMQRENTLIVATAEDELKLTQADHKIYGSDGEIRFGIFLSER